MSRKLILLATSLAAGGGVVALLFQLSQVGFFPAERFPTTALCLLLATLGAGVVGPALCERAAPGWGFVGTLIFGLALAGMAVTALLIPQKLPMLTSKLTLLLIAELSVAVVGFGVVRGGLALMTRQMQVDAAEGVEQ